MYNVFVNKSGEIPANYSNHKELTNAKTELNEGSIG